MSPRAAWRLETLGFSSVYDYAAGKNDWTASGLPTEGAYADMPRAGTIATREVVTCSLEDPVDEVAKRLSDEGRDECLVTTEDGVVLGRVGADEIETGERVAADVMKPGPTTIRYNESLGPLAQRMREADVDSIIVTDPGGRLVGVVARRHAEEVAERIHRELEHHHHDHG